MSPKRIERIPCAAIRSKRRIRSVTVYVSHGDQLLDDESQTSTGNVLNDGVNDPNSASGNSGLFVTARDNITTSGQGAIGILAQSIGGGGGLAGNTGENAPPVATNPPAPAPFASFTGGSGQFSGSGGYVDVTINQGATVSTSGMNAPAIFLRLCNTSYTCATQ
jgi:hypothetical protein